MTLRRIPVHVGFTAPTDQEAAAEIADTDVLPVGLVLDLSTGEIRVSDGRAEYQDLATVQEGDADLTAIAALTSAADKVPYATGPGAWSLADFTAYGRSLVATANRAALMALLGLTLADIAAGTRTMPGGGSITSGDMPGYAVGSYLGFRGSGGAFDTFAATALGAAWYDGSTGTAQALMTGVGAGVVTLSAAELRSTVDSTNLTAYARRGELARTREVRPTGAIAQTLRRAVAPGNLASLASGTLVVVAVPLLAGEVVSSITFVSRTTAGSGMTNQWFCLLDDTRVVRAVSADATSAAWGANTAKTLAMAASYTIPADGTYYLGVMVAGTTVPTLSGEANSTAVLTGIAPMIVATSSTGQTTPPSTGATMGAFSSTTAGTPYAYCS